MLEVNKSAAPSGGRYIDVRVGDKQGVGTLKIDAAAVAALAAKRDAQGYLPPGFPLAADGTPADDGVTRSRPGKTWPRNRKRRPTSPPSQCAKRARRKHPCWK